MLTGEWNGDNIIKLTRKSGIQSRKLVILRTGK